MVNQISIGNNLRKIKLFIYIFCLLLNIDIIFCGNCKSIEALNDTNCFNDVITFNHDKWRAGHASTNLNGDMIIEFSLNPSEGKKRLFYGLKKNGRYYFPNEPVYKEISEMQCDSCSSSYRGRFESRNLFVSLNTDTSKSKQYLFSVSTYYALVELIDIENNLNYFAWNVTDFLGLTRPIFSYEYSLFEVSNNVYIIAFIESAGYSYNSDTKKDEEFSNTTSIKKFQLDSFSSTDYNTILASDILTDSYDGRTVSALKLKSSNFILLLYVKKNGLYYARVYNENLVYQNKEYKIWDSKKLWAGNGIFFKGISVKDDYVAFAFYTDGDSRKSLVFRLAIFNNGDDLDYKYKIFFNSVDFRQDIQSNGFYKLTEDRLVLFTTEDYEILHMFLFDFYNNYAGLKIREYLFKEQNKRFAKEITAYTYNNYILLSATMGELGDDPQNIFAIIMIFGFANGTDFETDISPYLMDTGSYDESNNLYDFLMSKMIIDNNIFGYEKIEKIRLVSICDELLLYKGKLNVNKEDSVLSLNELFDANHTLLQNKNIKKIENKLYTLEYQYMVKEPDYNTFYSMPKEIINYAANDDNAKSDYDASSYYERKTFDGRTNILKFKLCHKYCINCIEYGPSDNDQRCETCKEDYTYDYLMYMNRFSGSCVPYNYMYDVESKLLSECTSSSKYYYNKTRSNKKYCFKYAYQCPDVYPYLNTDTKECLENNPDTSAENEPSVTTELPNNNPTQKESPVSTELPINIQTQKESPATTELPDNTPTQKGIDVISTSLIKVDECSGGIFLNNTCLNMTNKEIYEAVKDEIVIGFPEDGQSFVQEGKNDYSFQVTTAKNEKEEINSNSNVESAVVDLGDCEAKLKQENGITGNASLIIYKFYKNTERASKKEMQFEVYNPYTYQRLNLSICQS